MADYWVQTDSTRRSWIRRYEFWATRVRTLSAAIAALRTVRAERDAAVST